MLRRFEVTNVNRAAIALFAALGAAGQTIQGDLTGTVRDPSGAPVPGVKVTIVNETNGATRVLNTDDSGDYRAVGFFVASYRVEFEKTGFKKKAVPGVRVEPATLRRVDVDMQVGDVAESVEVRGDGAPIVQTEGTTINYGLPRVALDRKLSDNTRSGWAMDVLMWSPGSAGGRNGLFLYGGNRGGVTEVSMEGAQQSISLFTPPTAQEELTVISGNAPAEFARATNVNVTFKSGTNELHGDYTVTQANPCLNAVHTPFFRGARAPCFPQWRQNFGVGGPVWLPKLYNGKNKTFWYFNYSRPRPSDIVGNFVKTIPTARMRQGDYTAFPQKPRDPLNGQPFPNAVIPANRISPVAANVMRDFYSTYNYIGDPNSVVNNAAFTDSFRSDEKRWVLKFDQNIGTRNFLAFTYQGQRRLGAQSTQLSAGNQWDAPYSQTFPENRWVLADTHTVGPAIVNQARFSVTRILSTLTPRLRATPGKVTGSEPEAVGADILQRWGIQGVPVTALRGYPNLSITNWQSGVIQQSFNADTRYQFSDTVNYIRGAHAFKTGFSFIKILEDSLFNPGFGAFGFDGRFAGEPFADFLLGLPGTFSRTTPRPTIARRGFEWGGFFQDDWKVTPKLTLNLGVRWTRFEASRDKNGLFFNFDLPTGRIVVPDQKAVSNVSPFWNPVVPVVTADAANYPSNLAKSNSRFLPRFGFAYRPTGSGSFVVRGGYGIYTGLFRWAALQTGGPFAVTDAFLNPAVPATGGVPQFAFPAPFPAATRVAGVATGNSVSTDFRPEYVQQWNLTVEKAIFRDWGARISYIGNVSRQLGLQYNANTPRLSTQAFSQNRRPYPAFQNITRIENGGFDKYNALQMALTHQWKNGLYLQVYYAEQRSSNDLGNGTNTSRDTAPATTIDYAYDRARDRARNSFWPNQDFLINTVYDLPLGTGRKFGSSWKNRGAAGKLLNAVAGGWSFSGVFNWHSGNFATPVYNGVDPGGIGQFTGRPDLTPGCNPTKRFNPLDSTSSWWDPSCFTVPRAGTIGNAPNNILEGPGMWVLTTNPYKDFAFGSERYKLRFGAQMYNVLNHPVYDIPATGDFRNPNGPRLVDGVFVRRGTEGNRGRQIILMATFLF
ncbi:MAG: TonB-dependent receptor [Acidobacteria bacterium]|nr:TonB-dependent receptor [Acidobacteriota bacterium]